MVRRGLFALFVLACLLNPLIPRFAQEAAPANPDIIEMRECLILPSVGSNSRSPVHVDALETLLVDGTFSAPKTGDKVKDRNGVEHSWYKATSTDGWFAADKYVGATAFWSVILDAPRSAILNIRGHSLCYVNSEPLMGDMYNTGLSQIPVLLKKGANEILINLGRGRVHASIELRKPDESTLMIGSDWTLPDMPPPAGEFLSMGSVNVLNFSSEPEELAYIVSGDAAGTQSGIIIPALSSRRIAFGMLRKHGSMPGEPARTQLDCKFAIYVVKAGKRADEAADTREFSLRVVNPDSRRKVTFISGIDGSVQYYSVVPARPLAESSDKPGIVLSLHGASVEASGQAGAYSPKSWCHIVCPTNRRPYGFDWEDWGRLDAMEVLAHAQATLDNDPTKVWLTGHSMGGHGTWTVGSHFPDRFAAIAPSAGWESFWSYAGGGAHPEEFAVSELLTRAANPCRTLLRKYNYKSQGIYILHGDADDNVPVSEARAMRDALKEFHTDLGYFEQPGAGHWWDAGHDEGSDCLDWAPIFDMFARRRLPAASEVQAVDFTTVCPEHSADCHWARIEMQEKQLARSRIQLSVYPNKGTFEGTTENVSRLSLLVEGVVPAREKLMLRLDGGEVEVAWPADGRLHFRKSGADWIVVDAADPALKGPHRYGWFKNAFNHQFVYVYGTRGSEDDTAANLEKARFDLEQWGYRANGSFDLIADSDFDDQRYAGRNIILVGNADTNSAWDKVLKGCPLRLQQGKAVVGDRVVEGDDLAMLFVYPRAGTTNNCVGVIGGTGVKGVKLTNRIGYFVSGASFPDVILYSPEMLETGTGGVIAAGFLGEDWSVARGEFVWRDEKK